jgi:hypothetical protein
METLVRVDGPVDRRFFHRLRRTAAWGHAQRRQWVSASAWRGKDLPAGPLFTRAQINDDRGLDST